MEVISRALLCGLSTRLPGPHTHTPLQQRGTFNEECAARSPRSHSLKKGAGDRDTLDGGAPVKAARSPTLARGREPGLPQVFQVLAAVRWCCTVLYEVQALALAL